MNNSNRYDQNIKGRSTCRNNINKGKSGGKNIKYAKVKTAKMSSILKRVDE